MEVRMADIEIVSYEWDFGNGLKSYSATPSSIYTSGWYTVTLTTVDTLGVTRAVTKQRYIEVDEDDQSLDSNEYLENYKSLHFGWKDEHGFGWSENERDTWVLPFTSHSVYNYEEDGVIYTVVWDGNDGLPYVINTRDTYNHSSVYTDKALEDGTSGSDFKCTVKTPELRGDMTHYELSHLETNVLFRPSVLKDDYRNDFSVDFSLIVDTRQEPVETQYEQDTSKEVVFTYSNNPRPVNRTRQLQIETSTSDFQLLNYESYFIVQDKNRRALDDVSSTPYAVFADVGAWWTGDNMLLNMCNGVEDVRVGVENTGDPLGGNSAIRSTIGNITFAGDMGNYIVSVIADSDPSSIYAYTKAIDIDDDWSVWYRSITGDSAVMAENIALYDVRFLEATLPNYLASVEEYARKLKDFTPC